ncbi:hypothetical protein [uncultured Fusobacterium sp.]|uniref:hypothetical protein n=1 Tax=uncultured Fusobacterium sp. TaxID=159267 RepID=UPI0025D6AE70|nr:hypothetical protein [uncultured Fusobacterium sp.]
MEKYIYLGGTVAAQGMVLKKRSIIDKETYLQIKEKNPELLPVTLSLEEFTRDKAKIKKDGLNKIVVIQKGGK